MEVKLLCNQGTTMAEKRISINVRLILTSHFRKTFDNFLKYDKAKEMFIPRPHLTSQIADTFESRATVGHSPHGGSIPEYSLRLPLWGCLTHSRFLVDFFANSRRSP
jgi:hypothetical protein